MRSTEVLVIGQVARDLVLRVDDAPGPGGAAAVRERREMLGGKGANQAVALAQLGVPVGLLGVVGDDQVGDRLAAQARADGIDAAQLVRRRAADSALIVDVVDRHGRWRYLEDIPERTLVSEADVHAAAAALRGVDTVCVQLQQPPAAALAAVRHAKAAGRRVVLDGAPAEEVRHALLGAADVVRADAREAELLTGTAVADPVAADRAARELLRRGPSLVALAVDGAGNLFAWPGHRVFVPLVDARAVDPTGAGDAFVAGLTAALVRGDGPYRAARLAVAAAAATVRHAGGRPDLTRRALATQLARLDARPSAGRGPGYPRRPGGYGAGMDRSVARETAALLDEVYAAQERVGQAELYQRAVAAGASAGVVQALAGLPEGGYARDEVTEALGQPDEEIADRAAEPADGTGTAVPAGELSDDDLLRELAAVHRTRHDTLRHGSDQALRHHDERAAELEAEYVRRFPQREVDPERLTEGARTRGAGPTGPPGTPPRTGAEQEWDPEDVTVAEGRDPTPENVARARRELAEGGPAVIERNVP